jgi:hypothetical protein
MRAYSTVSRTTADGAVLWRDVPTALAMAAAAAVAFAAYGTIAFLP